MELWIRNMWKNGFYEVKGVIAREVGDKWEIIDSRYALPLGEYATRERCLEIIDEIQELLKLGNPENAFIHIHNCDMGYDETLEVLKRARETKAIITRGADFDVKLPSVVVYEMPKK